MDFIEVDFIIINRLLDDNDGSTLKKIAKKVNSKNIKIIAISDDFNDYEERKLVTSLVNFNVNVFLKFSELDKIEEYINDYPKEFDFSIFNTKEKEVEFVETVNSVFKEVIAVYSPLSQGSSIISTHLAIALAKSKNCRVCIVDGNPLKPSFKKIFDTDFNFTLVDALSAVERENLSYEILQSYTKASKYQKNLDILAGIYDINEYYMSSKEQYLQIIEKLKFNYDYVIIDTHSWYDVLTSDAALTIADKVIVPVKGNKHDINQVNRYLSTFEKYNDFDIKKFYAVVNHYSGDDLTSIELQAKLKIDIAGYINENNDYKAKNAFKNVKVINEYVDILNVLKIDAKKQKQSFRFNILPLKKGIK